MSAKRILDEIERGQLVLTNIFFVLTIVAVSFQVINRFWLQLPVVWSADFAVLCFIWLGFLSASVSVRKAGHFRVSMLLELKVMQGTGRRVLELFALAVILALSAVLVVEGTRMTISGLRETAPGLRISMAWTYVAVPLCSFTAILFALEKVVEQLRGVAPEPHLPLETEVA